MALIKVHFDDIPWKEGNEGILYKLEEQATFEARLLSSYVHQGEFTYYSLKMGEKGEKITSCIRGVAEAFGDVKGFVKKHKQ